MTRAWTKKGRLADAVTVSGMPSNRLLWPRPGEPDGRGMRDLGAVRRIGRRDPAEGRSVTRRSSYCTQGRVRAEHHCGRPVRAIIGHRQPAWSDP